MGMLFILGTSTPKGNKVENMHAIRSRLLYSFIIVDYEINIDYNVNFGMR
jgi:hypothetical protein